MFERKTELMDEQAMNRALTRICYEIVEKNHGTQNLCVFGVLRRGAVFAQMMARRIGEMENTSIDCSELDVTLYRDDLPCDRRQKVKLDWIKFQVENRKVIVVDDVFCTGRTARAAIDVIMDIGRPENIQLAVLIDRGHRELPIRPDFVGKNVPTSKTEVIEVHVEEYDGENCVILGSR